MGLLNITGAKKTYGTVNGVLGAIPSILTATADTVVSPTTSASLSTITKPATVTNTISPTSAASLGVNTKTTTASLTVTPSSAATASNSGSLAAIGVTVNPAPSATPQAISKSASASGVSTSPATAATPAGVSKPAVANTTITPTTIITGSSVQDIGGARKTYGTITGWIGSLQMTNFGDAATTVTPTTTAALGVVTKSSTASVVDSPSAAATLGSNAKATTANTSVTTTTSVVSTTTKSTLATGVLTSPSVAASAVNYINPSSSVVATPTTTAAGSVSKPATATDTEVQISTNAALDDQRDISGTTKTYGTLNGGLGIPLSNPTATADSTLTPITSAAGTQIHATTADTAIQPSTVVSAEAVTTIAGSRKTYGTMNGRLGFAVAHPMADADTTTTPTTVVSVTSDKSTSASTIVSPLTSETDTKDSFGTGDTSVTTIVFASHEPGGSRTATLVVHPSTYAQGAAFRIPLEEWGAISI